MVLLLDIMLVIVGAIFQFSIIFLIPFLKSCSLFYDFEKQFWTILVCSHIAFLLIGCLTNPESA